MTSEVLVAPPAPQIKSSWSKLSDVLFEPRAAFQQADLKPNWALPLLLITALSILSWTLSVQRIGIETIARTQLQGTAQWERMTPEARDAAVAMSSSTLMQAVGYVPVIVGPAILLLIISGAFLLAFAVRGVKAPFRKVFSVCAHAIFAYTLVTTILTIVVLAVAENPDKLDINNLVYTNLAFLAGAKTKPALATLLGTLDVLSFYGIYLLSLGNSVVNRKSLTFNLAVTTILWAMYVAGKVGIRAVVG